MRDTRGRVVALEGAQKSAADFLFLRTTLCSLNEFLEQYDFEPLEACLPDLHRRLFSSPAARHIVERECGTCETMPRSSVRAMFGRGHARDPRVIFVILEDRQPRVYPVRNVIQLAACRGAVGSSHVCKRPSRADTFFSSSFQPFVLKEGCPKGQM